MIAGWRCAVCGTLVDVTEVSPWRCPQASVADRHHVLHPVREPEATILDAVPSDAGDDPNPFVRFGPRLAWWRFARASGMSVSACVDLTREVADGFRVTPFGRSEVLSEQLGVEVLVKDETGNVAGSHKARHLVTILLQLRAAEELGLSTGRAPLAIASCGNAALAAATLAARAHWPLRVFVPEWMDDAFGDRIDALGAEIVRRVRSDGDPPGDPAMHGFRAAVAEGCIPFTVQGPENALCLDGGRTIGWEMDTEALDRVMVQVGGGAFATCVGWGLGAAVRLDAVQAEGCAPLLRAWERAGETEHPERRWDELMTPWDHPRSLADGILDDETYDWLGVFEVLRTSGGSVVVATEGHIRAARELAERAGFVASHTGAAGLAGLLAIRDEVAAAERVAVIMSGVAR